MKLTDVKGDKVV